MTLHPSSITKRALSGRALDLAAPGPHPGDVVRVGEYADVGKWVGVQGDHVGVVAFREPAGARGLRSQGRASTIPILAGRRTRGPSRAPRL